MADRARYKRSGWAMSQQSDTRTTTQQVVTNLEVGEGPNRKSHQHSRLSVQICMNYKTLGAV